MLGSLFSLSLWSSCGLKTNKIVTLCTRRPGTRSSVVSHSVQPPQPPLKVDALSPLASSLPCPSHIRNSYFVLVHLNLCLCVYVFETGYVLCMCTCGGGSRRWTLDVIFCILSTFYFWDKIFCCSGGHQLWRLGYDTLDEKCPSVVLDIWTLGAQLVILFERFSRNSLFGGGMLPEVCFKSLKTCAIVNFEFVLCFMLTV